MLVVRSAVEGQEDQPPRIEGGQRRGDGGRAEGVEPHRIPTHVGGLDDRILGEKSGSEGKTGQCQRADHHRPVGERELVPEATHVADVLLVMHGNDHRAGTEEEQRLEEGMREQVEHADRVGARAHGGEHVAEL